MTAAHPSLRQEKTDPRSENRVMGFRGSFVAGVGSFGSELIDLNQEIQTIDTANASGVRRWLAKDPILFNGGQANLYLYCHGDPIDWLDPFGLGESHYSYINVFGHMIIHIEDSRGISHQYGFGPYGDNSAYSSLFGTVEGVWTDWDVDPTSPWVQVVETNPLTSEDANALIAEFDDLVNAGPGIMGYRLWGRNCWFAPPRVVASVLNGGQAN